MKLLNWRAFFATVLRETIAPMLINVTQEQIRDYFLSEKYEKLRELEIDEAVQPFHTLLKPLYATALEQYDKKHLLIGISTCPKCKAAQEELHGEILNGNVEVMLIDEDPLGLALAKDLELDSLPVIAEVKKVGIGKVQVTVKDIDTGNVIKEAVFEDTFPWGVGEEKQKQQSEQTKQQKEEEKSS